MTKEEILKDYKLCVESREASLLGRKQVLSGKAKFGIFGDGKELPQIAMSKVFKKGDFRSGYYRDQTFMMAIGALNVRQFYSSLYAHIDLEFEPATGGRQMQGHFSTHSLNEDGSWKNLMTQYNSSTDVSTTGGQMPRLLGLAQASKIYREVDVLKNKKTFSNKGNEIAFGTIGNASTSEGMFFETINAAGVIQVPMIISVWDDKYGISVHAKDQTTKESISEVLKGFQRDDKGNGFEILKAKAWDYEGMIKIYKKAEKLAREKHIPCLVHIEEVTQPQGHSTSGSHERYKSKERLEWEKENDCLKRFREWILEKEYATENELEDIEKNAIKFVKEEIKTAWSDYQNPLKEERSQSIILMENIAKTSSHKDIILNEINNLKAELSLSRKVILKTTRKILRITYKESSTQIDDLKKWIQNIFKVIQPKYSSHLYSESKWNALKIEPISATYDTEPKKVDGRIIMRDNFNKILEKHPEVVIFGEDVGKIGDVNQGLEGMQDKYGEERVFDTGIREVTILGQAIGMSMRGLRPIAEIQYLDYLLYALELMSDDLATVHYRSAGTQKAPAIIRTRGHRLEGIWHAGSPMAGILNLVKGVYVLVPRNMTQAAGFYNTLLDSDSPGLVIECLNGYRLKENMPNNLGEYKTPIGVVETIKKGNDLTIISYGSTLRIVMEAVKELEQLGIFAEVIDAQSLIPFDKDNDIVKSLQKTNRLVVIDEDVPGGASAFIMQQVLENQNGYYYLDSKPLTITAKEHRCAFADDGDYFSKPSVDDIIEEICTMMNEVNPKQYPTIF